MLILATNLSHYPLTSVVLSYVTLSGSPVTDTCSIPPAPSGSSMGSVVTGTQPASAFTGITVTMGANVYTVAFGSSIPAASGLKLSWAQNADVSEIVFTDESVVGEH